MRCVNCAHEHVAYNSYRNRHCPKCQGKAANDWLAARQAELLPVPYYHASRSSNDIRIFRGRSAEDGSSPNSP